MGKKIDLIAFTVLLKLAINFKNHVFSENIVILIDGATPKFHFKRMNFSGKVAYVSNFNTSKGRNFRMNG